MKRLCPIIFLNIIVIETAYANQIKNTPATQNENHVDMNNVSINHEHFTGEYKKGSHFRLPLYSPWARWSECRGGQRTRRRHCVQRLVCRDSLRIEVARCKRDGSRRMKILTQDDLRIHPEESPLGIDTYQRRQLDANDVQRRFRGFSPWGTWSSCSRKCTTVRRRYCQKQSLCGRKVIRQSAYCYLEGSYCQRWIRTRMQRRKNPGYGYKIVESMSAPASAIHPEDTRLLPTGPLDCGRLGHYRGSSMQRMRARMQDMVRIIGGRPAPAGKWPWQVVVLNRYKEAFCGGTLVALRWVVTAAHCVRKKLYVRLGEYDLLVRGRGELEMRVTEAVVHPRYDPDTVVNDVALLRLPASARLDLGHGIACLPHPHQILSPHTTCVILGWGKKRPTDVHGTRLLHEAQVSTIQQGVCRRSYWQYAITDNMVCAGRGRRDSCAGDSGGPLLCRDQDMRYYLQGITSFGDGCGKRGKYGIYTRTAGYVTWMQTVMNHKYFD